MGFDRDALIAACRAHARVARVVVTAVRGSAPREVGSAMLVWDCDQSGTIGGGALEHGAAQAARALLATGGDQATRHALGPDLGQCCGGSVDLLTEVYDLARAEALDEDMIARGPGEEPLAVTRLRASMRNSGQAPTPHKVGSWFVEPVRRPERIVWIWGAGHVGRALVAVLHPLPGFEITWVDTDMTRFPDDVPATVGVLSAAEPASLVRYAPPLAEHLVATYSHAIDLQICHALLGRGFRWAGLIGSATKWARFRSRLRSLGHPHARIDHITCPIGVPALGKHPQAIAVGVATELLRPAVAAASREDLSA